MAAGYAERIADQIIAERQAQGHPEILAMIRDALAEAAERGYALAFGVHGS